MMLSFSAAVSVLGAHTVNCWGELNNSVASMPSIT